jgi:hypothetical protein
MMRSHIDGWKENAASSAMLQSIYITLADEKCEQKKDTE